MHVKHLAECLAYSMYSVNVITSVPDYLAFSNAPFFLTGWSPIPFSRICASPLLMFLPVMNPKSSVTSPRSAFSFPETLIIYTLHLSLNIDCLVFTLPLYLACLPLACNFPCGQRTCLTHLYFPPRGLHCALVHRS